MLIEDTENQIPAWVASQIPWVSDFGPAVGVGVTNRQETALAAGVVFHEYQPNYRTIQLSMAAVSPMWATRENITALLHYPFEQLGVFKLWTATPLHNKAALKVNEHIGLKREGTLAHHFGEGNHAVIMRMLAPDYHRLYGGQNG